MPFSLGTAGEHCNSSPSQVPLLGSPEGYSSCCCWNPGRGPSPAHIRSSCRCRGHSCWCRRSDFPRSLSWSYSSLGRPHIGRGSTLLDLHGSRRKAAGPKCQARHRAVEQSSQSGAHGDKRRARTMTLTLTREST
eukprot:3330602-Rhodomonas_salina.2